MDKRCIASAATAMFLALACALASPGAAQPDNVLPEAFDAGWHGERVCEKLFENDAMRVGRCTFPPGIGHERHWHPPHWGYIVSGGTMRITDASGTEERTFESGGSWWSDGVEWHEAVNIGETTAVYVIVEPVPQP